MKTYVVTFSTAQEVKAEDEKQAIAFACEDAEIDNLNQYNVIVEDEDYYLYVGKKEENSK